jgi:hypothetical protein
VTRVRDFYISFEKAYYRTRLANLRQVVSRARCTLVLVEAAAYEVTAVRASLRFTWSLVAVVVTPTLAHANVSAETEPAPQLANTAPALVIEIGWELTDGDIEALLASCEAAYSRGACRTGSASPHGTLSGRVESQSTDHVVIELHVSDRSAERFVSRELSFRTEDSSTERAKTVGLTLGVIAAGLDESRAKALPAAQKPSEREPVHPPETSAAVLLLAGVSRDPGLPTFDVAGALRGELRADDTGLLLRAGLDGSRGGLPTRELNLTRLAPTVGTGWGIVRERFGLALGLDAGAEWLRVSTTDVGTPVEASRWSPLLRASATMFLPVLPYTGLALSTQVSWTTSPTTFFVRHEPIEGTSGLQLGVLAGFYVGSP